MKTLKNLFGTVGLLLLLLMGTVGGARAQTTVSLASSGAFQGGQWGAPSVVGGHTASLAAGSGGDLEGAFNGTGLTLLCYLVTAPATVSIDGAAATNPGWATGAWTVQTVATGLTAGSHTFVIRFANVSNPVYVDTVSTWGVTGGAGTVSAPSPAVAQSLVGTSPVRTEGGWATISAGGYAAYINNFPDEAVRVTTNSTTLSLWGFGDGAKVRVATDGVDSGAALTLPNTSVWGRMDLVTPGSLSGTHTYQVTWGSQSHFVYALILDAGATSSQPAARTSFFSFGNSITAGMAGTANDSTLAFPHLLSMAKKMQVYNRGLSGTTAANVSGSDTTSGVSRVAADIVSIAPGCAFGTDLYGTNDAGQVKGAETAATFQSAINAIDTAILNGTTTTKIYELGILPTTGSYNASLSPFNSAKSAAVAAVAAAFPTRVITYNDTGTWLTTSTGLFDQVHPNPTGYAQIESHLYPLVSAILFRSRPSGHRAGSRSPL